MKKLTVAFLFVGAMARGELTPNCERALSVAIYHSDTPADLSTLPPDVSFGLTKLQEAYERQPTNTVDVFREQRALAGKNVDYIVAKDAAGPLVGFLAVVFGSRVHPISLSQFGVVNEADVQIELKNMLVLTPGRKVFTRLVREAIDILRRRSLPPSTLIWFWVDEPVWASALRRLGAPEVAISETGIWAFGVPLDRLEKKFSTLASTN